jgi:hypothetical protein
MQSALVLAAPGAFSPLRQAQDRLRQQGRRRFFLWFLAASGQKPKKKKSVSTLPEAKKSACGRHRINKVTSFAFVVAGSPPQQTQDMFSSALPEAGCAVCINRE